MANTVTVQVNVSGWSGNREYGNTFESSTTTSPLQEQLAYAFATGFNTLTVPTGAKMLLIANISGTLTLKGITGDTGRVLSTTNIPCELLDVTSAGTISFNASAGCTADLLFV